MLFSRFINEIETYNLLNKNDFAVAAVSGGADSVCLLHLLSRLQALWGFSLSCAHIHHCIRKEADEDADFVKSLCALWNIPFLFHKEDVLQKARTERKSVELVGREVRYSYLKSIGADVILTAHNKNDVAESVLLHLIRGCGTEGLCGIAPKREDGISRPLLSFTRAEIEAYLRFYNLTWREDQTNADTHYTRNKIRHEVIPLLSEINPSFVDTLVKTSNIVREEESFLEKLTSSFDGCKTDGTVTFLSIEALSALPLALQRRVLRKYGEDFADINGILELLNKKNGAIHTLKNRKIAEREYESIVIYQPDNAPTEVELPENGEVLFGNYRIIVGEKGIALPKNKYQVRCRRSGDCFIPEGMRGRKKVGDYFTDMKIPNRLRNQIPIFTCNGEIALVGDLRRSQKYVPEDNSIIHIRIEKE